MSLFYRLMRRLENSSATVFELMVALAALFLVFGSIISGVIKLSISLP